MKTVELYARVRHAVLIEGISERAAADRFGINARTVSKMLKFSVPPGYVRRKPPFRPKLDEFAGVIDAILASDRARPKKQRHTSKPAALRREHCRAPQSSIGWCPMSRLLTRDIPCLAASLRCCRSARDEVPPTS